MYLLDKALFNTVSIDQIVCEREETGKVRETTNYIIKAQLGIRSKYFLGHRNNLRDGPEGRVRDGRSFCLFWTRIFGKSKRYTKEFEIHLGMSISEFMF